MSGSGGGGFSGGFDEADPCDALFIETQLSSPKEQVIEKITLGDVLSIMVQETAGISVVVALYQGEVAGGIAAPQIQRLRECMAHGTLYDATVTGKNDGQVRVRIRPVP
jgi:hypothetical protein